MSYTKTETIITGTREQVTSFKKLEDWRGNSFESSSATTPEFAAFANMYRARMKKIAAANGLELVAFNRGHFYCSGFFQAKTSGKLAYFSISDVRSWPDGWHEDILVRTAQHAKDYTGGANQRATLQNLGATLARLTGSGGIPMRNMHDLDKL